MAIRAANRAFRDFGKDSIPTVAGHHITCVVTLNARHVIQFQDNRIAFTAIWLALRHALYFSE